MLTKCDEDVLNDRLRNWGRWALGRKHARSTMIYRMMVSAGEIKIEHPNPARQVDLFDALLVNRAWGMLAQNPYRYWVAKWTLVAHYVFPWMPVRSFLDWVRKESKRRYGHEIRLREKDYEILLATAKYQIFNLINQHASKRLACYE